MTIFPEDRSEVFLIYCLKQWEFSAFFYRFRSLFTMVFSPYIRTYKSRAKGKEWERVRLRWYLFLRDFKENWKSGRTRVESARWRIRSAKIKRTSGWHLCTYIRRLLVWQIFSFFLPPFPLVCRVTPRGNPLRFCARPTFARSASFTWNRHH